MVFKTENRGYGLKARKDLKKEDFVGVYLGEVLTYEQSLQRDAEYEKEGRKVYTIARFFWVGRCWHSRMTTVCGCGC